MGYEVFFDLLPREHLKFLKPLKPYHRTPDVLCVHAGILDDRARCLRDRETKIWGPQGFPDGYHGREAVVYGHWDNSVMDETGWPGPCIRTNGTIGLDAFPRAEAPSIKVTDPVGVPPLDVTVAVKVTD